MALEQAPHGTVVLAEEQTAGRGRMGRSFHSPAGSGIYMSFILRPNLTSNDAVLITTAASVAVARAIEEVTHIRTGIKWVNDVYMNGKKICGILTEALTDFESGGIESIILGIGINFSTAVSSFPENIQQKVDSLFHEKPAGITRNQIAAAVINHVLCLCNQLQDRSFIAEYKARSIVLGKDIEVIQGTNSEKATAIDIDENGGLMIEKQDGTITSLHSGEISIRGTSLHERKIKIYCILSYFMRIVCSFNRSGRVY
ncbi:MAG: biotin--[acetyl-CoA-carboxylase] ligase [Acutalibacteraceae bacterium]